MKPPPFDYLAPTSLDEALALRAQHADSSAVLAGGQSLVPMLNLRIASPELVLDLGRIPELAEISEWDSGVAFGAMTRQRAAERSDLVRRRAPLIVRALEHVGHVATRNRGTIGGSIAHADPAAELPAAALALDAQLVARSSGRGERTIAAADFFKGVLTTALAPDELLVAVRVPALPERSGVAFLELARRHRDFSMAGAGAAISLDTDGAVADVRLVFIGVGAAPVRAAEVETALRGEQPHADTLRDAAEQAVSGLNPPSDVHASGGYRRRLAAVLARRALEEATPR